MRSLPRDGSGRELMPPPVRPQLNQRIIADGTVDLVTLIRSYELITPLFGGGVVSRESDPVTLIRGSEIRGQLRFWWRACRGGRFNGDLKKMRKIESEIWGAASTKNDPKPSQVWVVVEITNQGKEEQLFETGGRSSSDWRNLDYVAFPLQEKDEQAPRKVRDGVTFTLLLTYPKSYQEEIEAALWAWETFGGVGARTRRGFGSLKLIRVNEKPVILPRTDEVEAKIREGLEKYVVKGIWPPGVPHLSLNQRMKITSRFQESKAAWEYLVKQLREFRQSRYQGAHSNQPGRSRWPEPDEIRRLTDCRCDRHAMPVSSVRKFPRAAFGLPIIFHFKDEKFGDPYDTKLQCQGSGRVYERLASPLILRPIDCANGAVGLAIILEGTGVTMLPSDLVLSKEKEADMSWQVEAIVDAQEAKKILPLNGESDVLQAFLKKLK